MALQFILGGAGSGKSYYLNHALVEEAERFPERRFIAIVPEQFTMETQKALTDIHPGHSIMNITIISFERLAYRVFEELSCMPETVLDDMGKSMLLRRACGTVEKKLKVYRKQLDRAGFIDQLKSMMSELGRYRLEEKELSALAERFGKRPLLQQKLTDMQVFLGAFREALGEGMITAEELLPSLCRVLSRSKLVKDSVIALDGFTGFTPAQYEVLELLLLYAKRVMVAVTVDAGAGAFDGRQQDDLFAMSRKTIEKLSALSEKTGAGREKDVLLAPDLPPRFSRAKDLALLSENLFRYPCRAYAGWPEHIVLTRAADPVRETELLTERISALVREEGYRYREIAVVCGNMEQYRPLLEEALRQAQIPAFLDDKRSLFTNPAVEYMRAALEVVEKDFAYEPVFRYFKCGFCGLPEQTLYEMENYVLAFGIRGHKQWETPWERLYRGGGHIDLSVLNEAREQAAGPLLALRGAFKTKGVTVKEMTEALYRLLEEQGIAGRLSELSNGFAEAGEYSLAKEYEQAYEQIVGLFDRIVGLLGGEQLSVRTYNDVLDAGCREIRVGVIPAAMDRVLVGDVERSRLKDIKALFFIGVNDGNIPAKKQNSSLLSVHDREELAAYAELAPIGRESSLIDKFYFYLTVTKPSHKLYISYAAADEMGEKKSPSPYLAHIRRVFPSIREEAAPTERPVLTKPLALRMLADGMEEYRQGKESPVWDTLYGCLYEEEENRALLARLAEGAFYVYRGDRISDAAARALYGEPLSGSVTRLETFAACAYAQFLSYGLELVRRKEFEFAALDMGNVFHKAIELCFKEAAEKGLSVAELSDEERHTLAVSAMARAADSLGSSILDSSARNRYLTKRMEQITEKSLWALGEQLRAGSFEPAAFELTFAPGENEAMRISLSEQGTMQLRGKIDRVDLYEDEDAVYVKIIDYKSGGTDFDLNGVYYGLQMQLVVYLDAVMRMEQKKHPGKEIVPAGMFYYQVQDPVLDRAEAGEGKEAFLRALRPRGVFNGDGRVISLFQKEPEEGKSRWIPATIKNGRLAKGSQAVSKEQFANLKQFVLERMKEFGTAIASGEVSAKPYKRENRTGCDYCDFKQMCGFDRKLSGYEYKRMPKKKPEEIWTELSEKNKEKGR